jgi:hypothetical protein
MPNEVTFETGPASAETLQFFEKKRVCQMHSRVVQVFASLAVEAFVNDYGYLRLGEAAFEKLFTRQIPIAVKLTKLLHEVFGSFDEKTEIISVVKSLAARRNRLVHPRPEMQSWTEHGEFSTTTQRLPAVDSRAALAAVRDMDRFFELFVSTDIEGAMHLGLGWSARQAKVE